MNSKTHKTLSQLAIFFGGCIIILSSTGCVSIYKERFYAKERSTEEYKKVTAFIEKYPEVTFVSKFKKGDNYIYSFDVDGDLSTSELNGVQDPFLSESAKQNLPQKYVRGRKVASNTLRDDFTVFLRVIEKQEPSLPSE